MNSRNNQIGEAQFECAKATMPTSGSVGKTLGGGISTAELEKIQAERRAYDLQQVGASINAMKAPFIGSIESMQEQIFSAMKANGFWEGLQDNFGAKTALVHSELSEMLEANRKDVRHDDKVPMFTGEEAEAADTIIRLLDMAGRYNWRLGEAIVAKMQHNLRREYKHGKAY